MYSVFYKDNHNFHFFFFLFLGFELLGFGVLVLK